MAKRKQAEPPGPAGAFRPQVLREYALIADGERGALVGSHGEIAWMCAPSWHDDGVFSALIGGGGIYAVTPDGVPFVWGGYYEPGSLIWHSRWVTTDGIAYCREALAFPGKPDVVMLLRRVVAVNAPLRARVVLDARHGFGFDPMRDVTCEDGVWTGRSGKLRFRWSGGADAKRGDDGSLTLVLHLDPGQHHDLVLELSEKPLPDEPPDPQRCWTATEDSWKRAIPDIDMTVADPDARHAYVVMRGLTSVSGAMVAAATMSLPERAEQGRNYDYRYAWIRDQCFAGQAAATCGPFPLLDDAVRFVSDRLLADGTGLRPAYTVHGGPIPDERRLGLPGYPGGFDKVGNWVNHQFQLDAFGEALLLFAAGARHDRLDSGHWRAAETAVNAIEECWTRPDAGIWELDERQWTHSKLTCAAGLRALSRQAPPAQAARWTSLADQIVAATDATSLHPSGRWQRCPDDERVDAALLLPTLRGLFAPDDARAVATVDAVERELMRDGYVYRFRPDERPLGQAEGAFLLCGFVFALAIHREGRQAEAARWFERNRAACGPPALLAEEYDVGERQLRGNLPQAFVHAMLLETARRLAEGPDS